MPEEPLDAGGHKAAERVRLEPRFRDRVLRSPARAARETAEALGLASAIEPALADIDHGAWSGLGFAEIEATQPEALARWLADPLAGAPDGETLVAVQARAGAWLDGIASCDRAICAITHPMVVRAILAHALALPLPATLAIDIAPLSRLRLSFNRAWRLQSLAPCDAVLADPHG